MTWPYWRGAAPRWSSTFRPRSELPKVKWKPAWMRSWISMLSVSKRIVVHTVSALVRLCRQAPIFWARSPRSVAKVISPVSSSRRKACTSTLPLDRPLTL